MKIQKRLILFLTFIFSVIALISLNIVKAINSNNTILIYLDPGHGGFDGGATSTDKLTVEKEINLITCLYLKSYLEKTGIKVKLTRSEDKALSSSKKEDIYTRVKNINRSNCDLYISIHVNSYPNNNIKGSQTFYNEENDYNKMLATNIMESLRMIDITNKRVAKSIKGKYLLDHTKKTGCLVELGFLSNEIDLNNLKQDKYIQKISFQIYLGILDYLKESRIYE